MASIPSYTDLNSYTSQLNRLLGTDKIGGSIYTPPAPVSTPRVSPLQYSSTPSLMTQTQAPISSAPKVTTAPAAAPAPVAPRAAAPNTSVSIVDYLNSTGKPSDFTSRKALAESLGITGYTGSATQNTQLLAKVRGGAVATPAGTPPGTPTAEVPKTPEQLRDEEIGKLSTTVFEKPSKSSEQIYSQAYDAAGLKDLKGKIADLLDDINQKREEAANAIGSVNENPFLVETSRVGRGKRILDQLETQIGNKLTQVEQLQSLYNSGLSEVEKLVTRQTADFGANQAIDEKKLNFLLNQKENEQTRADKLAEAPTTIGSSETGVYRWDRDTQSFVQIIKPKAPDAPASYREWTLAGKPGTYQDWVQGGGGGGAGAFKPTAEQKAVVGRFVNSDLSKDLGFTDADKSKLYADSNFFYWTLQKATEAGVY